MEEKIHMKTDLLLILTVAALVVCLVSISFSAENRPDFQVWLAELRTEALAKGISKSTLDEALRGLEPIPRVIELDRDQPEFTLTLQKYLNRVVPESRVAEGRRKLAENRAILAGIYGRFGVQPRFLVALWGVETNFGQLTGGFPVIGATATLAYDGRRGKFFRNELLNALRIVDQGHISAEKMKGSWAGATGQFQFMPSAFQKFAVDYEQDGRIDIWNNPQDAFASAANYLVQSGWVRDQIWGREARLPKGFSRALVGLKTQKHLSQWQALGVRLLSGQDLPKSPDLMASVVEPEGPGGRAFVVYKNYRAILSWNRSHFFAIAVGTLADRIEGP
jgi:membrane-bound lytic murein transglycosylase B